MQVRVRAIGRMRIIVRKVYMICYGLEETVLHWSWANSPAQSVFGTIREMQRLNIVYGVLAVLGLVGFMALLFGFFNTEQTYAEAKTIMSDVTDFKDLSRRFEDLAKEKGGVYAYGVLLRAPLPPNADIHLLGHTIGDVLYTQEGVDGVALCTQDFRNACSHSIVIGALNEFGEPALDMIREACHKAPGGSGAYTMCFHGLGHGVFAYFNYEIPATINFCRKTGTEAYFNREYVECVGGMIMELMGGGGHNKNAWDESRKKYLAADDPLAPCSTAVIPGDVKGICYMYLTPHLFERAGADLAMPDDKSIAKSFLFCDTISHEEKESRRSCFGGIGKEFPLLAVDRDTRAINTASDQALLRMHSLCMLAPHQEAHGVCSDSIVDSLFWGGENKPDTAIRFCALAATSGEVQRCFAYLFDVASFYVPPERKDDICSRVPEEFTTQCANSFRASL